MHVCSQFKTVSEVLSGARHMVAMQLAHEPLVRQVVREAIIDRLKLSCAPTKKGFKVRFSGYCCQIFVLFHNLFLCIALDE